MRDSYIGNTFFDASASAFFLQKEWETVAAATQTEPQSPGKTVGFSGASPGPSVGPDWCRALNVQDKSQGRDGDESEKSPRPLLDIQFGCEVEDVREEEHGDRCPVSARLTNGLIVKCDFMVSATGVQPNTSVVDADYQVISFSTLWCRINRPKCERQNGAEILVDFVRVACSVILLPISTPPLGSPRHTREGTMGAYAWTRR